MESQRVTQHFSYSQILGVKSRRLEADLWRFRTLCSAAEMSASIRWTDPLSDTSDACGGAGAAARQKTFFED